MSSSVSNFSKLQTLTEDLETVTIDEIPSHPHVIKKQTSSSALPTITAKGLGIHVPRRPSDSILHKSNQFRSNTKLSIMERPVSNDSILSTNGSEFSQSINDNSRNSSITSGSISNSPVMKGNFSSTSIESKALSMKAAPRLSKIQTTNHSTSTSTVVNTPMASTSNLSNLSMSSVSTLKLTPSQRLKLTRKNSLLKSQKQKESYFEDHYNSDEESSAYDEVLIWNVPYAGGSTVFSPISGKSTTTLKQIIDKSPAPMPMSPLPGKISDSLPPSPSPLASRRPEPKSSSSRTRPLYKHPDEAQSLSRFYEVSSNNYSKRELMKRQKSMPNLPAIVKTASDLGLDDMKLISQEKTNSISSTRPIWLPPKDSKECKKHESAVLKMFEDSARLERLKKEKHNALINAEHRHIVRWGELNGRGLLRNTSISEIKKLVFKCPVPDYLRYEVWNSFLKAESGKKKKNSELLNSYEKFQELNEKLQSIPNLPADKIESLRESISKWKTENYDRFIDLNEEKLLELLKLRLISKLGLDFNVDLKLMALLLLKFNQTDTFNMANLAKLNVFNNEVTIKKFNDNLAKNSIVKKYLQHNEFSKDLQQLSFNKILPILVKISSQRISRSTDDIGDENQIIFQIVDILFIHNDYKSHYALMITILRHYHFGFLDIDDLLSNSDRKITVPDRFQFFEHFYHYHKKF